MPLEIETFEVGIALAGEVLTVAGIIEKELLVLTADEKLFSIEAADFKISECFKLPQTDLNLKNELILKTSPTGRFCVLAEKYRSNGVLMDLEQKLVVREIYRGSYHVEHCGFTVDFFEKDGQEYLVYATDWNRLDILNLASNQIVTDRKSPDHREPHYLDYFHAGISISPGARWIVDNGWVWHPYGVLMAWDLEAWLKNEWESEDGESKFDITGAGYFWDRPLCWIDGERIAYWGVGGDDEEMADSVVIYDLAKRAEVRVINGVPKSDLFFDKYLFCSSKEKGLSIWDIEKSKPVYANPDLKPQTFIKFGADYLTGISEKSIRLLQLKEL